MQNYCSIGSCLCSEFRPMSCVTGSVYGTYRRFPQSLVDCFGRIQGAASVRTGARGWGVQKGGVEMLVGGLLGSSAR